jgi:hypothetical protein
VRDPGGPEHKLRLLKKVERSKDADERNGR